MAGPRFDASRLTLCLCLTQARTPEYALMAKASGFDAIYVDLEHASTSLETASMLCVSAGASGLTALVRPPGFDPGLITRALDGGAHGVIVPRVRSAETARAVVETCRFAPEGGRGPIASNAITAYAAMSPDAAMQAIAERTIVGVMLESAEGVAQADAICAVPGVDLAIIGAFDLSSDLGIFGQAGHPLFRQAVATVAAACARHGVLLGLAGVSDPALIADYVAAGVRFISAGTETGLFLEAARRRTAALRDIAVD